MSAKLQVSHQGHDESDEDCDMPTNEHEHSGNDLEYDIPSTKQWQNKGEVDEITIKKSRAQETSLVKEVIEIYNTHDRPADATAEGAFAGQGSYVVPYENQPGKRNPKVGYKAEAGYGRARAEYSVLEAEARGPNAGVKAEASLTGVEAMARAEVFGAEAKAGPVAVKLGLGFDTGASAGLDGVGLKVLGTGAKIGLTNVSVSVLGSEASVSCSVM